MLRLLEAKVGGLCFPVLRFLWCSLVASISKPYMITVPLQANANIVSDDGSSALISASENGHADCCKLLLACQADIGAYTTVGRTPLSSIPLFLLPKGLIRAACGLDATYINLHPLWPFFCRPSALPCTWQRGIITVMRCSTS